MGDVILKFKAELLLLSQSRTRSSPKGGQWSRDQKKLFSRAALLSSAYTADGLTNPEASRSLLVPSASIQKVRGEHPHLSAFTQ